MLNYAAAVLPHRALHGDLPGPGLTLTALSINLVGDGLRDALDPQADK